LMLHPYPRQLIFGPRIQGIPWSACEDDLRADAHDYPPAKGFVADQWRKLNFPEGDPRLHLNYDDPSMIPLLLDLVDDEDVKVRRKCLRQFWPFFDHAEVIVPV